MAASISDQRTSSDITIDGLPFHTANEAALIDEAAIIERILRHLDLWEASGRRINAGDMAQADHAKDEIFRSARRAQDNFRMVAEGADWIVVDEPAGLLTHPTRPDGSPRCGTGLRQLLAYELALQGGEIGKRYAAMVRG